MSEFMDRARAEAEQTIDHMGEGAWADGVRYGIYVGVASAAEQEPTDAEVEAADKAFHEVIMSGEWVTQEQAIRAALRAAQKVRAGQ